MTKEEIKKQIAECEERLKAEQERLAGLREELDKPEYGGKRWKPERGERYYCVTHCGEITTFLFNSSFDLDAYVQGNCFKTKEEAEFEVERRKVIAELSDYAEGDEAVWDGNTKHWFICYSFYEKEVVYDYYQTWKSVQLYFPSIEAAEAAVKAVGEERVKKYYLGIKED